MQPLLCPLTLTDVPATGSLPAVVEARDGYRVPFERGELAPDLGASPALLALRGDGATISDADGPLRLIVAGDGRAARWVRQVPHVHVRTLGE